MIADAIKDVSRRGGIVLDLFGGSGSTMIAAHKTGRRARLCELDPVYCDRILQRWETFAKDDAELIACGLPGRLPNDHASGEPSGDEKEASQPSSGELPMAAGRQRHAATGDGALSRDAGPIPRQSDRSDSATGFGHVRDSCSSTWIWGCSPALEGEDQFMAGTIEGTHAPIVLGIRQNLSGGRLGPRERTGSAAPMAGKS
jgi:DNA methylase